MTTPVRSGGLAEDSGRHHLLVPVCTPSLEAPRDEECGARRTGKGTGLMVAAGVVAWSVKIADPGISPNEEGLPGLPVVRSIVGALLTWGLVACVAGLVVSVIGQDASRRSQTRLHPSRPDDFVPTKCPRSTSVSCVQDPNVASDLLLRWS